MQCDLLSLFGQQCFGQLPDCRGGTPRARLKDDCGPHSLRHTTLDWLRSVSSPQVLATFAGHIEPGATRHYLHPQFTELCQAVERLFGPLNAPRHHAAFDPSTCRPSPSASPSTGGTCHDDGP